MSEMVKLAEICDLQNGFAFKSSDYIEKSNTLNIRMSNIRPDGTFDEGHKIKYLPDTYAEKYKEFSLKEGDIVIAMTDMANDPKILGLPTLVKNLNGRTFLLNQRVGKLNNFSKKIHVPYLCYFLRTLKNYFKEKGAGGLQINISKKEILSATIHLPSLKEQQSIIAKLDATFAEIDNSIAAAEVSFKNAEALFQKYLTQVFEYSGESWYENNLKELTSKIGSGATPRGGYMSYKESGISLIRSMNVHDKGFLYTKLAFIDDTQAKKLDNVTLEKDDVLINITGASVARCCIVPEDVLPARVNQHVSILRTKKSVINPKLLHFILISPYHKSKLLRVGEDGGATRQAITKTQLQEYVIRFPKNYNSQSELIKKIIDVQNSSLKIKSVYENKLKNFIQLKQSIIKQTFTEKLIKTA